jgi:hypothetical protein
MLKYRFRMHISLGYCRVERNMPPKIAALSARMGGIFPINLR